MRRPGVEPYDDAALAERRFPEIRLRYENAVALLQPTPETVALAPLYDTVPTVL